MRHDILEYNYKNPVRIIPKVDRIKRLAMEVLEKHYDSFDQDFVGNKKILDELATVRSKALKNKIAGCITRRIKHDILDRELKMAQVSDEEKMQEARTQDAVDGAEALDAEAQKTAPEPAIEIPAVEDEKVEFKTFYHVASYDEIKTATDIDRKNIMSLNLNNLAKPVASFANSTGGDLYLGMGNDGKAIGLAKSKEKGRFKNYNDDFANDIVTTLGMFIDNKGFINTRIKSTFVKAHGKTICQIHVEPSGEPIYVKSDDDELFFIRSSAAPRGEQLKSEEKEKYLRDRFGEGSMQDGSPQQAIDTKTADTGDQDA